MGLIYQPDVVEGGAFPGAVAFFPMNNQCLLEVVKGFRILSLVAGGGGSAVEVGSLFSQGWLGYRQRRWFAGWR